MEENIRYDERKKILTRKQVSKLNAYGEEKYGYVERTDNVTLTEEGIKKIVSQMESDKKSLKTNIEKRKEVVKATEEQIANEEKSLKELQKEIELVKKTVGSRINWKDTKNAQNGSEKPTEKQSNTSANNVTDTKTKSEN